MNFRKPKGGYPPQPSRQAAFPDFLDRTRIPASRQDYRPSFQKGFASIPAPDAIASAGTGRRFSFAARRIDFALAIIVPLCAAIVMTMRRFLPVDRPAAALLAPYARWIDYAAHLTVGFFILNP